MFGLHKAIRDTIKDAFVNFYDKNLLKKMRSWETQNINGLITTVKGKRCPKYIYLRLTVLDIATVSAVTNFKDTMFRILNVFCKQKLYPIF